jgi:2-C-methyl-D-erythritol 4-phosphate cytidylyltransferase
MSIKKIRRTAIVLAAGNGQRLNLGMNKSWLKISGKELAIWSLIWLKKTDFFDRYILVVRPDEISDAREIINQNLDFKIEIIAGGTSRHGSETAALKHISDQINAGECHYVLIHDGARPLATVDIIADVVQAAEEFGGSLPYLPTAKLTGNSNVLHKLVRVQTPQVFKAKEALAAYQMAEKEGFTGSDTAMCLEKYQPNLKIKAVLGSSQNIKVTYPDDIALAESMLTFLQNN